MIIGNPATVKIFELVQDIHHCAISSAFSTKVFSNLHNSCCLQNTYLTLATKEQGVYSLWSCSSIVLKVSSIFKSSLTHWVNTRVNFFPGANVSLFFLFELQGLLTKASHFCLGFLLLFHKRFLLSFLNFNFVSIIKPFE